MLISRAVRDLQPGDLVEMKSEYELFDPRESADSQVASYEYGEVDEVFEESDGCLLVSFTNLSDFAFPGDHVVRVHV